VHEPALRAPEADSTAAVAVGIARRLSEVLERDDFTGWDPFDALASPVLRRLARGPRRRQAAIQLLKRAPVNPRPLLGVPRLAHTKALALLTSAHARLAPVDADPRWARLTPVLAERLAGAALQGPAWGYDFDVQTRWAFYPRGRANAVATAFAIHALLDAGTATGEERYGDLAARSARWAVEMLQTDAGWFRYYSGATVPIHNASLLLAGACARVGLQESAGRAAEWSVARQASDGTWPYGEAPGLEWVDGFHTGFNLEALGLVLEQEDRPHWRAALERGTAAYRDRLLEPDGAPRASLTAGHPYDVHAAATAITTLSRLAREDPRLASDAGRVLAWALAHLQRGDGRFAFQVHRRWRNEVPYIRWSDGHMLLALATFAAEARHG
jgi:hypothetical protein